jgi:[FeFe] hydrogenase H-cluster maturation GTPase HydF
MTTETTPGTPKSFRLHIGLFGRRNVGKSSLLNALLRQEVAIVSDLAGTTTDPVEKAMELRPLGPVLFIDTAGVDDVGEVGALRVQKTERVLDRTDLAILVATCGPGGFGPHEERLLAELSRRNVPTVVAFNRADEGDPDPAALAALAAKQIPVVRTVASRRLGSDELFAALLAAAPADFVENPSLLGDLVAPGDAVVLVTPIDEAAPRGRLILPQVQAIRDILDHDAVALVAKEHDLPRTLALLARPPKLLVTDSQAFAQVAAAVPADLPMTGFSVLMARMKGDLTTQVEGALAIDELRPGDRVLVAEGCGHHATKDDIGRVKIPRWLAKKVGGPLQIVHVQGQDFPDDLSSYRVVIHCGACTFNRRAMLTRLWKCRQAGVPVTNYGLTIAHSLGILERALGPFPAAQALVREAAARKDRR